MSKLTDNRAIKRQTTAEPTVTQSVTPPPVTPPSVSSSSSAPSSGANQGIAAETNGSESGMAKSIAPKSIVTATLGSEAWEVQSLEPESLSVRYQATLEECQRYRSIGMIAQQLRQCLNPLKIYKQTAAEIRKLLQTDRVVLYRREPAGHLVPVAEALQDYPSLLKQSIDSHLTNQLQTLCQTDNCLVIHDIHQTTLPADVQKLLHRQEVQSTLIAPILRGEQWLGMVSVQQCRTPHAWQPIDVETLQQLATEVVIALQQAELHQKTQRLNEEITKRTSELQTALDYESMLKRITDKVRDSLDESQILQAAVQELTLGLKLGGCNAALYNLTQGTSTISYEYTNSIPAKRKVAQMDDFPEIYQQLKQGRYFQFCSLLPNSDRGQVAMLACPIFVDPQSSQGINQAVLGDLWLIHNKDHIFDEYEIRLVQQVANQCAIAIRQARLYQAAQVQVQELEKLNRLKDEFLSTVSHELRTPIANVKMAIQMLKISTTEEKRRQYLEILEKESTREAELINDLLDLQRLEASSYVVDLEEIHLQTWLSGLVEPFQSRIVAQQQQLEVICPADIPPLKTNEAILRRILAELLNNACKYTPPEGRIRLQLNCEEDIVVSDRFPDRFPDRSPITVFTVSNQAQIPPSELPKIFDKFYRCPNPDPWSQPGTGLGLALVQKLVEQLNGTINAESRKGWTTFTIKLPKLDLNPLDD